MTRPLRINLAGGWYHVTARGNERRVIYRDDEDRDHFLNLVAEMVELFQVYVHTYEGGIRVTSLHSIIVLTPSRNPVSWFCDDTTLTDQPGRGLVPRDSSRE